MGENIFDDVTGEFTLTNYDFLMDRYHNRFGKLHIDADGPWEETPFKRTKNKIMIGIDKQVQFFFNHAGKDPETDELTKWDVEGALIETTRRQGYFESWSHKEFDDLYNLFEEDEIEDPE